MARQVKRDWTAAREKVEREGRCRVCKSTHWLQAAHTISRSKQDVKMGSITKVLPVAIVPLCQPCHEKFDAHRLNLLPCLTREEQICAVAGAGSIESARKRLVGKEVD